MSALTVIIKAVCIARGFNGKDYDVVAAAAADDDDATTQPKRLDGVSVRLHRTSDCNLHKQLLTLFRPPTSRCGLIPYADLQRDVCAWTAMALASI
jgi:hypothetical protein